jgi:prevent-host-death family protein
MRSVGVRELKAHTSRVLREVHENGEPVEVTLRGRAVARLVPVSAVRPSDDETAAVRADLDELAAQIGARWPSDTSAAEAVHEVRREL